MNKRNTAKEKKKRNKGYPYKTKVHGSLNDLDKWQIVSESGKFVKGFRTKRVAEGYKEYLETN